MRKCCPFIVGFVLMAVLTTAHVYTQEPARLILPEDFEYLGAFRLPEAGIRPDTFEYGGNAMTFNPDGDPSGEADGFPGSLFITGHDRLAYGELPDGSRIAEVTIPAPVITAEVNALQRAVYLQPLTDAVAGFFVGLDEIPRIGLQYLNRPETGPLLHVAWGQHLLPEGTPPPTHAWLSPDLAHPNVQGSWFVSDQYPYSVNGYLLEIPSDWADAYVQGRYLGAGRFRDGGWSGMGPSLFAYRPWIDEQGTPAPDGAVLDSVVLLLYADSNVTTDIENSLAGYQHPDEWEGGAWLTTSDGRSAVLFAGTKSVGEKYWYGWVNPAGPAFPCVETAFVGQYEVCRLADGSPCPPEDLLGCSGHNDFRGWWSSEFVAQFILYNPDDLAQVAQGTLLPHEPQPYTHLSIDEILYHNPDGVESDMLGVGMQRRGRIGDVTYDRANQFLYVVELFADGAQPVVHVWHIS
ncbi:MAG: hypothetical protein KJ064_07825 [Anaerolineae bacterium]|nr:hypothetical protein [Anaerolineae bacterium]